MKHKTVIGFIICSVLLTTGTLNASENNSKQEDIRHLLLMTDSEKIGKQIFSQSISIYKTRYPNIPGEILDLAVQEADSKSFIDLLIPIYDKYFTHEDIKELINFHSTPIGKKLIKVSPALTADSMAAGMEWGKELSEQVDRKVKKALQKMLKEEQNKP